MSALGGTTMPEVYFYPRSPCGERPCILTILICTVLFLSTLSLRRATHNVQIKFLLVPISIHALLAESDEPLHKYHIIDRAFLSTLSLRRATAILTARQWTTPADFYPRSPCGERPKSRLNVAEMVLISIHALLAESDGAGHCHVKLILISIHALLAESDVMLAESFSDNRHFYPRSPCGERRTARN